MNQPINIEDQFTGDKAKVEIKENSRFNQIKKSIGFATSFEELDQAIETDKFIDDMNDLIWSYTIIADNIFWTSDPDLDKKKALADLTNEFNKRIQDSTLQVEDSVKSNKLENPLQKDFEIINYNNDSTVRIIKSLDGKLYLHGIYSNSYIDLESDVLTESSHKEFFSFLDQYPELAPELWLFHLEETAFEHKAIWWSYDDNFSQMLWPLEEHEAKYISNMFDAGYDAGMSHGFYVLFSEKLDSFRKIKQYRTFECSILPLEYAANPLTSFQFFSDKLGVQKMSKLNDAARQFLTDLKIPEDTIQSIDEKRTKLKEKADQTGLVSHKQVDITTNESISDTDLENSDIDSTIDESITTEPESDNEDSNLNQDVIFTDGMVLMTQEAFISMQESIQAEMVKMKNEIEELKSGKVVESTRSMSKSNLIDMVLGSGDKQIKSTVNNTKEESESERKERLNKAKPDESNHTEPTHKKKGVVSHFSFQPVE